MRLRSGSVRYTVLSGVLRDLEAIGDRLEHLDEHDARDKLSELFDLLDERMATEHDAQERAA